MFRLKIFDISRKFRYMDRKRLNLFVIKKAMYNLDNLLSYSSHDLQKQTEKLLEARTSLNFAISEVKSLFETEPGKNSYLSEAEAINKHYTYLNICLGGANAMLDQVVKEILESERGTEVGTKFDRASVKINLFRETLIEFSESLVIMPLINSYKKFNNIKPDKNGKVIQKDFNLFSYFVFYEFYRNVQIIGAPERQITMIHNKITNVMKPDRSLSYTPDNIEMVDSGNSMIEDLFGKKEIKGMENEF